MKPLAGPPERENAGTVALSALAREWERAVDGGLGDEDLTIVTRALQDGRS